MDKYSKLKNSYKELYFKEAAPILKKYEKERKTKLIIFVIVSVIIFILAAYSTYAAFIRFDDEIVRILYSVIVFMLVLAILMLHIMKKHFSNKVKENIMPLLCKCLGNIHWTKNHKLSGLIYIESCLLPYFDSSCYDDSFYGEFDGVKFEIQEPYLSKGHGKGSKTIFDGVIIKMEMNKKFKGRTVIKKDSPLHISPSEHLRHTVLEDVKFEKKFDVFTNDEVEARYLITPSFMERINNLAVSFNASFYSCAFYKGDIFIALETNEDLFSIGSLFVPADDIKQYSKLCFEIISIISLIDYFKLNEKTGL